MNIRLYLARRFLALIPTLFGISLLSFLLINLAPGGPIEQALQKMKYAQGGDSSGGMGVRGAMDSAVTSEVMESLKRQYGYDKPLLSRYGLWLKNLVHLNFGESFHYRESVLDVIKEKLPVSLTFGFVSFFISYLVSIPLGIFKAMHNGSKFDLSTSFLIFLTYSIPSFMLAILALILLGPGNLDWFPLQGIHSDIYDTLSPLGKIWDRIYHAILPLFCYSLASFATLTVLMKNSILEEIRRDYVRTARAKGLSENVVVFKHVLRNALIPIATGLGSFLGVFFAGSLMLEKIFNLDGIGLLSFNAVLQRDFNVVMGLVILQSFLSLLGNILSDVIYFLVNPRLDFSSIE